MSVLIRDMKMPKRCKTCQFSGFGGIRGELHVCMFTGENQPTLSQERMSGCPLIELPEHHGRLIDADELVNGADAFAKRIMQYGGTLVYSQSAIDDAPTIIPAEEVSE